MRLESLVQLQQVVMAQVVSQLNLASHHRSLNRRTSDEPRGPVATRRPLDRPMNHAKRTPVSRQHTQPRQRNGTVSVLRPSARPSQL